MGIANPFVQVTTFDVVTNFKIWSFPRFCMNANVAKVLPSSITLSFEFRDWVQQIICDHSFIVCQCCFKVGCIVAICLNNKRKHIARENNGKRKLVISGLLKSYPCQIGIRRFAPL